MAVGSLVEVSSLIMGNEIEKVAPPVELVINYSFPWCFSTTSLQNASPIPLPPVWLMVWLVW